jgi:hypothetical protein
MHHPHGIDLGALNRAQLKQLLADTQEQLRDRGAEDRGVLAERCKTLAVELGFDETVVRVAGDGTRAARRTKTNGDDND